MKTAILAAKILAPMTDLPTKLRPLPTPTPIPEPMPPPEPPPKPFEPPPAVMPDIIEALEETGRSGREMVAVVLFEVMRAAFFARVLAFLGWILCGWTLARSPELPPPAPVAKLSGSFLTESVTVEITQIAAIRMSTPWMIREMVRPSPPSFCQKERRWRAVFNSGSGRPSDDDPDGSTGGRSSAGGGGGVSSLIGRLGVARIVNGGFFPSTPFSAPGGEHPAP